MSLWMPMWKSNNKLDGKKRYLIKFHYKYAGRALLFTTRQECRDWINKHYGYIKHRKDLRSEPHGWRLPEAVKVDVFRIKKPQSEDQGLGKT